MGLMTVKNVRLALMSAKASFCINFWARPPDSDKGPECAIFWYFSNKNQLKLIVWRKFVAKSLGEDKFYVQYVLCFDSYSSPIFLILEKRPLIRPQISFLV